MNEEFLSMLVKLHTFGTNQLNLLYESQSSGVETKTPSL